MLARITHYNRAFFALCKKLLPTGRKKFFVLPVVFALVSIGIFAIAAPTHAEGIFTDILNGILVAFSWIMFVLARLFIGITIFALKFFIEVASYNNFIDTPTVKIGWFLVRDVANMFFVVLLLVIAFGTILGLEQYEWKKTLIKLLFAAVFINFSNMIAQLIIDVAHVFTITFVNAISATAGGNIIQLFNIDAVYKITGADKFGDGGDLKIEAFAASVASFLLAAIMMATMGAFAIVMAARMVILWVLIILSPLAYIFQVIPQTQKYAQEWWSEFTNHVIVAPVMVFFLWLAFATLNSSVPQLDFGSAGAEATSVIESGAQVKDGQKKLSISEATSWENLASFLITTVFLIIGLKTVRNLGVVAGGLTSSATGFVKNVATIATGVAAGRAVGRYAKKKGDEILAQPAREWGDRMKKRINIARATMPVVRKIPFIGRMGELRRQKLNEELDRNSKMTDENIIDTISRKENIGTLDRVGKKFGFGIEAWKKKRYKLEAEEDVIKAEKAESKRGRKAGVAAEQAKIANKAVKDSGVVDELKKEKEEAINEFRNKKENKEELADVGEAWAKANIKDADLQKQANDSLESDVKDVVEAKFDETEGSGLRTRIEELTTALKTLTDSYEEAKKEAFESAVDTVAGNLGEKDIDEFDKNSQKKVEAYMAASGVSQNEAIAELMKKREISPIEGGSLSGMIDEKMAADTDLSKLKLASETAQTALTGARNERKGLVDTYTQTDEAQALRAKVIKDTGDVATRAAKLKEDRIATENRDRFQKAEAGFATTKEAKDLATASEKKIFQLADDIATGKYVKGVEVEGDAKARQAIAERIRMQAKTVGGDRKEAEKRSQEAQLAETFQKSTFGEVSMILQDAADQLEASSKAAAEVFKNNKIAKQLEKAADLLEKRIKAGAQKGGEALVAELDRELSKNSYAQAAQNTQKLEQTKKNRTMYETMLGETAKAYSVEMPNYGVSTPSTTLVPWAESVASDLKTQEAGDAASFASSQLAHLLLAKKKGTLTRQQRAFMMGTAMHVGKNGWFDDVISQVATDLQKAKNGEFKDDKDKMEQLNNLRDIFVGQLGIINEDETTGKYTKTSDFARVSKVQQLMVTAGDTDYMRDHETIQKKIAAAKKGETVYVSGDSGATIDKNDSYSAVVKKLGDAGQLISMSAENFENKMQQSAEFMQEASSFFKREAINVGHQEYGAHFQWDNEMNAYRVATLDEAATLMAAEARKFKGKLKWQYHGLGEADVENGVLKKVDERYAKSQLEELNSVLAARQMPERSVDAIAGYGFGNGAKMDGQFALIGESEEAILKKHGTMEAYIKNVLVPLVAGNADTFNYVMAAKAQHVDRFDADKGLANIKVAGTDIQGRKNSDFLNNLLKYIEKNNNTMNVEEHFMDKIRQGIAASSKREEALRTKGRGDRDDEDEADMRRPT
ncbi:MAG: hypothetical protein CO030_05380 [Candidatus Magasanikbacteria bacterium CG_4_9_14_0_2_um_filter_42_11]|uniref:Uncharacterized protein n=1 Tax=Candidatus Magasanikbacteria bacterium CG_4_9_14_0_2_um_filter_42_11 TaxID=1974643 RepID=A0A2M8F8B6_9BACT|nr:MAG: hypothetical protein COY70_01970 [Candidatus Magasanikbacteria bacterium CG_4_10_14_0_8_um_filter_42_12]PJC51961.1 MAG: hypothetical protein CO030_05380 [Candidatus Magasanikbacteria bacterium CG_4_9_14_0_2_um_filter_42_11]